MNTTLWIIAVGWAFVLLWVPFVIYSNRKVHPKALFILFFTEMWERFSYYGMRALLVLYMTKVLFIDLAQELADSRAYGIYGSYTAMVYLFPVLGGLVADKYLGFRRTIIWGGILMAIGHFVLALQGIEGLGGNLIFFFTALAFIIVGNGFFKPNLSSFLGDFYSLDDSRKDGAFSIYYMGVNIGAFLATLTCGYVGQEINWHYGFGLAGIGMTIGVLLFSFFGKAFHGKGLVPKEVNEGNRKLFRMHPQKTIVFLSLLAVPICAFLLELDTLMASILLVVSVIILIYLFWYGWKSADRVTGQRLWVVIVLFIFHSVFWALFEQAGGSLTIFADRYINRNIFGADIPSSLFQSLNPLYIMLLAPVFSFVWIRLRKINREPSTPMKFVWGLAQLALGYGFIVLGARYFQNDEGLVPVIFLFLMYLFHTTGELSLSPVGLSMVTKLSPVKMVGFVMGIWFLSIALANKMAGVIGKLTASGDSASNEQGISNYIDTYWLWGFLVVMIAALTLRFLVPILRRWMNGIH